MNTWGRAAFALLATMLLCQSAIAQEKKKPASRYDDFGRSGVTFFIPTGSAELTSANQDTSEVISLDDDSNLGFQIYGLLSLTKSLDAGLVVSYLPTVNFSNEQSESFEMGSQADLDARLAYRFGIADMPDLHLAIHGDGGLSFFGESDEHGTTTGGTRLYNATDHEANDEGSLGWNVGAGIELGYSLIPLTRLIFGLDYNYYKVSIFSGDADAPPPVNQSSLKIDATGNRFKISLGFEVSL